MYFFTSFWLSIEHTFCVGSIHNDTLCNHRLPSYHYALHSVFQLLHWSSRCNEVQHTSHSIPHGSFFLYISDTVHSIHYLYLVRIAARSSMNILVQISFGNNLCGRTEESKKETLKWEATVGSRSWDFII